MSTMSTQIKSIQGTPQQGANGKWSSCFEHWRHFDNSAERYMAGEVITAAVWPTAEAALEAGHRALQTLEETDRYPNMCEPW